MLESDKDLILSDDDLNLSVKNGADVIIGQKFYLDIEIPKGKISQSLNIGVKDFKGFESVKIIKPINIEQDSKSYNMVISCTVKGNGSITVGEEIHFTLTGVDKVMTYYARDLVNSSIQLKKNKSICATPNSNDIDDNKDHYISYDTTLFDTNGQLLKHTPVNIYSEINEDIERNIIITSEPDGVGQKHQIIKPKNYEGKTQLIITSDENGRIKFRVYPVMNTPAIMGLISQIEGVAEYHSGDIYMISVVPPNDDNSLNPPDIPELEGGSLESDGRQRFEAEIDSYPNVSKTDNVLFFNKKKEDDSFDPEGLIFPVKKISDVLGNMDSANYNYTFLMRRDIFPSGKDSMLYYIIAPEFGNSMYSYVRGVTYIGDELTSPNDSVKRTYNMPMVFSSFADIKQDPKLEHSDDEEKPNHENITQRDVSNYAVSGCQLYVKFLCTNDENDSYYPLWGEKIYLRMYISSANQNFNKIFPVVAPHAPDKPGGKLSTVIIKIDSPELNDVKGYVTGGAGKIYFEYYIIDPVTHEKIHSNYWRNEIMTSD
ncbi:MULTISPECIES: hypothetical protein [Xenorhabdus]|uniref:hypothetical protein n=1 Tax=Xenorhabdus TaxID=626 RepID=UPI00064A81E3|nr:MULTISPECIES: hypothetical protein [Xenorhabdus]KLU14079.1 hypothetical protein AAY47_18380 [Xenorhabdus griffiniae]KOP32116.1 hypothetical protein AFK69_17035 [Xenorhabdus sp. GDc328]